MYIDYWPLLLCIGLKSTGNPTEQSHSLISIQPTSVDSSEPVNDEEVHDAKEWNMMEEEKKTNAEKDGWGEFET